MNEPSELTDDELLTRAHEWRRRALQGAQHARGHAHAHEAELRRRFSGIATTMPAPLDLRPLAARSRPWWQFW